MFVIVIYQILRWITSLDIITALRRIIGPAVCATNSYWPRCFVMLRTWLRTSGTCFKSQIVCMKSLVTYRRLRWVQYLQSCWQYGKKNLVENFTFQLGENSVAKRSLFHEKNEPGIEPWTASWRSRFYSRFRLNFSLEISMWCFRGLFN